MSHTRAASLAFPPPAILRIDHSQANPLKLALSWDASAEMPASMTLRAEIHPSRSVGGAAVPLSAVSMLVSADDPQPWELLFSSQQTNLDLGGKESKQFALTITGIVSPSVLYTLASADLILHRHPCSQLVPAAVSPLLYATTEDVDAIDERVTAIEENGGSGIPGPVGPPGTAATLTVGTVSTGSPGSAASVTNSGTSSAAVLNFVIPRGDTGPAGATGAAGTAATLTVGTVSTGAPGSAASVTNSGTSSAAVLNFVIPRGDTGPAGATGAAGAAGTAATLTVGTVSTGAPGSAAAVTNSGTSSAAVLNFVIPRGDTGPAGAAGPAGTAATVSVGTVSTGAPGSAATVTNSGTAAAAILDFVIPRGADGSGSGISDNTYADIVVSGSGSVWTINAGAVTSTKIADAAVVYAKIQSVTAQAVLCRAATTNGAVGEITLAASRLLGRGTTGNVAAISVGNGLAFSGAVLSVSFGSTGTTVCVGNDARLSDARTPTAHAVSHQGGGADAIKLDDLAAPDDNTDLNATTLRHGLLPKLSGQNAEFLAGDGAYLVPLKATRAANLSAVLTMASDEVLTAVDPGGDRLLFWNDTTNQWDYLSAVAIANGGTGATDKQTAVTNLVTPLARAGTTANFTLQASDSGAIIEIEATSAINITVPSGLPAGFNCVIVQGGTGQATLVASGVTLKSYNNLLKTAGQNAAISIFPGRSSGTYIVTGATA
jgi:hypothetical protein